MQIALLKTDGHMKDECHTSTTWLLTNKIRNYNDPAPQTLTKCKWNNDNYFLMLYIAVPVRRYFNSEESTIAERYMQLLFLLRRKYVQKSSVKK